MGNRSVLILPRLGDIRIGDPDANAEFFAALRGKYVPVFLDAYFMMPHFPVEQFKTGEKYIIYGQKGTGKTSTLRYIDRLTADVSHRNEFIIFRKSFLEEVDVSDFAGFPLLLDEDDIARFKHYHHAIKRVAILILLQMLMSAQNAKYDEIEGEDNKSLVRRIKESSVGDVIRLGFDSIRTVLSSVGIDAATASGGRLFVEGGKALKRSNDDLLKYLCESARKSAASLNLFFDEIHFAYRTEESLQQDAILVRDCILAISALNDRFAQEAIPVTVYAAVRSEYLEHPIISSADINHTVESVGYNLSWSTFPANLDHPLFDLLCLRFKRAVGPHFEKRNLFSSYLYGTDAEEFLNRTWSKPRDFVRFFKCAKELYPLKSRLSRSDVNAVWRRYSQEAWNEIKSASSPFMNPPAIARLEGIFRTIVPDLIDKRLKLDVPEFAAIVRPVYEIARGENANFYDFDHFLDLLFILGIFRSLREDAFGESRMQSYHRGNRSYHRDGAVLIHPAVMKAFG